MFIISLSQPIKGQFRGWVQDGDYYQAFVQHGGSIHMLDPKVHMSQYETYEHFVGVMSKFVPEIFFFKEKLLIKSLTIRTLSKIAKERNIGIDTY